MRLTYSVTPPNLTTPTERRRAIARAQSALIASLPIDGLLVYDVQDESSRNPEPRPFAFCPKVDPLTYAFEELDVQLPRVVYRAVTGTDAPALRTWLDRLRAGGGRAVLVGAPTPDAPRSLTLTEAYAICRSHSPELCFGGVVIPERHAAIGAEDARVWTKAQQGCTFFVSQTVWSVDAAKRLLLDLSRRAEREGTGAPPLLLTFSPCGSPQTLQFQEWLGVEIPPAIKRELLSASDMFARSVELAAESFTELRAFADAQGLTVGCNVESVSSRLTEIQASEALVRAIDRLGRGAADRAGPASDCAEQGTGILARDDVELARTHTSGHSASHARTEFISADRQIRD